MNILLKSIHLTKHGVFFALFLFISLQLNNILIVGNKLFHELIYNAVISMFFGFVWYLALAFLDYIQNNLLKEAILKKDPISLFILQCVIVILFFAITAFILNQTLNFISGEYYLGEKYILIGIILFNYFVTFIYTRFFIHKKDVELDYKVFSTISKNKTKLNQSSDNNQLSIYGLGKNEVVHMDSDDFIFAKSDGHYLRIYYFVHRNNLGNKKVRSILVKNSLKTLITGVFADFSHITRVHKSYITNYNYVKSVRNLPNNKGGVIAMNFVGINIPVGPTKINNVNAYILLNNLKIPVYN